MHSRRETHVYTRGRITNAYRKVLTAKATCHLRNLILLFCAGNEFKKGKAMRRASGLNMPRKIQFHVGPLGAPYRRHRNESRADGFSRIIYTVRNRVCAT